MDFWELSIKNEELYHELNENRKFVDDYIDRKKFDKNIRKIAEFIFEEVGFYRNDITYICGKNKFYINISEYQEKEKFFKTFCDYKIFGRYNDFVDVYHGNFSQLKFLVENFNRFRPKSKNTKIYKIMTSCHELNSLILEKAELTNVFKKKFRKQKSFYLYRPYLIFME